MDSYDCRKFYYIKLKILEEIVVVIYEELSIMFLIDREKCFE